MIAHTSREGSSLDSVEGYTCRLTGNTPQECSVVQIYTNMHHTTAVGVVHSCPEARSPGMVVVGTLLRAALSRH